MMLSRSFRFASSCRARSSPALATGPWTMFRPSRWTVGAFSSSERGPPACMWWAAWGATRARSRRSNGSTSRTATGRGCRLWQRHGAFARSQHFVTRCTSSAAATPRAGRWRTSTALSQRLDVGTRIRLCLQVPATVARPRLLRAACAYSAAATTRATLQWPSGWNHQRGIGRNCRCWGAGLAGTAALPPLLASCTSLAARAEPRRCALCGGRPGATPFGLPSVLTLLKSVGWRCRPCPASGEVVQPSGWKAASTW
mmetsp:Transcript_72551/g.216500  ORF Transcript_72551/g.216500 Transcript_72551/m.216500 type:complete len:256 (+) Transcript_72551:167-934(+)